MTADGSVGPPRLSALQAPVQARIDQIRVNLERARWMLHDAPQTFVVADIAGLEAGYFCEGKLSRRASTGAGTPAETSPTPSGRTRGRTTPSDRSSSCSPTRISSISADSRSRKTSAVEKAPEHPDYLQLHTQPGLRPPIRKPGGIGISAPRHPGEAPIPRKQLLLLPDKLPFHRRDLTPGFPVTASRIRCARESREAAA